LARIGRMAIAVDEPLIKRKRPTSNCRSMSLGRLRMHCFNPAKPACRSRNAASLTPCRVGTFGRRLEAARRGHLGSTWKRAALRSLESPVIAWVAFDRAAHEVGSDKSGRRWRLACSFALVNNYLLQGRCANARKLFDLLLSRCNDVAEEFNPRTGRFLGNFPRAYS